MTHLAIGTVQLDPTQSRHARNVMRLREGDEVELFDSEGNSAPARIVSLSPEVRLLVEKLNEKVRRALRLTIGVATPKGPRADWLVEKLSELDVAALVPLASARTIVHPEAGKLARWERIAAESAKQCRRGDVMQILPPAAVREFCASASGTRWCLSTEGGAAPAGGLLSHVIPGEMSVAIGPEGGWTDAELDAFSDCGFQMVSLTSTILRIETAAIAAASLIMTVAAQAPKEHRP